MRDRALLLVTSAAAALLMSRAPGLAQTVPAATAPADAVAPGIGDIVVTAQKREQRLQDVPVVVTVLNAQQLEAAQVKSVNDLVVLTPGLSVNTNQGESTTIARIRGVGNVADNPGLEQSVGLYIDGVYRPRNGVSFNDLGELSDVEILKGPQGTLFGKNTIAGVIQITTLRPSFKFGATGEVTAQNYGGYGGSVTVTGPLIGDQLAGRLYVAARERDGYVDVRHPAGTDVPKQNDEHMWTARGQLLWERNSNFNVNLIADYSKRDDHCCVAVDYLNGFPAAALNLAVPGSVPNPVGAENSVAYLNRTFIEHIIDEGVSATANWTTPWFDGARLTSITAYRDNKDALGGDSDDSAADLLFTTPDTTFNHFRQFSQELQYRGSWDRLDWQVGAFFSHEILDNGLFLKIGGDLGAFANLLTQALPTPLPAAAFVSGTGSDERFHQVEDGEAIYTQEVFKLTDQISLIGGLRYTWEHKSLRSSFKNVDPVGLCNAVLGGAPQSIYVHIQKTPLAVPCFINPAFDGLSTHQSLSQNALTGTAKIQYKFNRDDMAYASYSRGNLVGGFNLAEVTLPYAPLTGGAAGPPNSSLAPASDTSFPGEWVDAWEVGAKTMWLDRTVVLNAALFYQSYTDHQLNAWTGVQFVEFTIPEAVAEGAELEGQWAASHDLRFNFGVTYANTYYPDSAKNKTALQAPQSNLYLLPGKRLTYAPFWSAVVGAAYQHPLTAGLKGSATVNVKYASEYQVGSDEDPMKDQKGYALVDATLGVATTDDRIAVTLWATNLFNQFYKQAAFDGVVQTFSNPPALVPGANNYYYFPSPPRFFGVTLKVKY